MSELLDSGARRDFETGAVRDISDGKGRCDLLPLAVIGDMIGGRVLIRIDNYVRQGDVANLRDAIRLFAEDNMASDVFTAIIEASKQYEDGARKYSERNWEKGIPVHCFIDSGVRHYLKYMRRDNDEPHDRAFVWNILGAIWTHENKPELVDLPFVNN